MEAALYQDIEYIELFQRRDLAWQVGNLCQATAVIYVYSWLAGSLTGTVHMTGQRYFLTNKPSFSGADSAAVQWCLFLFSNNCLIVD